MGLEYDDDSYNITLVLHGVSFSQESNRSRETSGLYPFMSMVASNILIRCVMMYMIWQ
jgi:hypothetical protein